MLFHDNTETFRNVFETVVSGLNRGLKLGA